MNCALPALREVISQFEDFCGGADDLSEAAEAELEKLIAVAEAGAEIRRLVVEAQRMANEAIGPYPSHLHIPEPERRLIEALDALESDRGRPL